MTRRALAALFGGPLFAWHAGWSIVFEEVHDRVEVRIDGPTGKLLRWKGRGSDKVSWTRANCEQFPSEQRPLDAWIAKDAPRITFVAPGVEGVRRRALQAQDPARRSGESPVGVRQGEDR